MRAIVMVWMLTLVAVPHEGLARDGPTAAEVAAKDAALVAVAEARDRLGGVEARLAMEPAVRDVQRWAESGGRMEMAEARRLLADARAAGALPWIRLRGRFEDTDRLDRDELGLIDKAEQDSRWTAELWLEWDLADAMAGPGRLRAVKEVRDQMETRQAVVHQVTLAYHDRQRLLLEGALDPTQPGDLPSLTRSTVRLVRVRELDATLDALTGGRWGRALAELGPHDTRQPRYRPRERPAEAPDEGAAAVAGG